MLEVVRYLRHCLGPGSLVLKVVKDNMMARLRIRALAVREERESEEVNLKKMLACLK